MELVVVLFIAIVVVAIAIYLHDRNSNQNSGSASPLAYTSSTATELFVSRNNSLNQPGVTTISNKSVGNASARIILNDIDILSTKPAVQTGTYNCPNDDGVKFSFKFKSPTVVAQASASGCAWISVGSHTWQTTPKFWDDVSNAIGQPYDPSTTP